MTLQYFRYSLPFKSPLPVGNEKLTNRNGIIINFKHYYAEAAPLPGLSNERIDDIEDALKNGLSFPESFSTDNYELLRDGLPVMSPLPSLQFAIESLMLSAFFHHPLPKKLSCHNLEYYNNPSKKHHPVIKIKLRKTELDTVKKYCFDVEKKSPDSRLRIDTNGCLERDESITFFKSLPASIIDYVEAPCNNPKDYVDFYKNTGLSYAIDSDELDLLDQINTEGLSALIIKPTIIGGISTLITLRNRHPNTPFIFSSCFESLIGLRAIARYASLFSPKLVHGLDTEQFFKNHPTSTDIAKYKEQLHAQFRTSH